MTNSNTSRFCTGFPGFQHLSATLRAVLWRPSVLQSGPGRSSMKVPALLVLLLWAAASFAQQVQQPAVPPSSTQALPPQTVGPDYIVGPGDTLQIFVWRNPELTTTVPVRPDGKITTPLVQDMVAV